MSKPVIVAGWHGAEAALRRGDPLPRCVWMNPRRADKRADKVRQLASGLGIRIESADPAQLDKLSDGARHQGVVVELPPQPVLTESDLPALIDRAGQQVLLLVLDNVQDPQNLGACLRAAAAAGVTAVIVPKDKSAELTPAARRAAAGTDMLVPLVTVGNLARALEVIKEAGVWLVGATGEAEQSIYEVDCAGPTAWVLGAEGSGLRRLTSENCDWLARIPIDDAVESLNVSTAAAVCLFETVRRRRD